MKAITLWQPWASLIALGVKTIETRSWPAPTALIGQRIAIHAAKRQPDSLLFGDYETGVVTVRDDEGWWLDDHSIPTGDGFSPLPLGAVVATARFAECLPMVDMIYAQTSWVDPWACLSLFPWPTVYRWRGFGSAEVGHVYLDQVPYGDFASGRWAWMLDDVEQLSEPIPARGGQRIWNWEQQ